MSDIPEGATHKLKWYFCKKESSTWFAYIDGWWWEVCFNETFKESELTPIKQDKDVNVREFLSGKFDNE